MPGQTQSDSNVAMEKINNVKIIFKYLSVTTEILFELDIYVPGNAEGLRLQHTALIWLLFFLSIAACPINHHVCPSYRRRGRVPVWQM